VFAVFGHLSYLEISKFVDTTSTPGCAKNYRGFNSAYRATKRGCDANLAAFLTGGITYVDMMMLDYPGEKTLKDRKMRLAK